MESNLSFVYIIWIGSTASRDCVVDELTQASQINMLGFSRFSVQYKLLNREGDDSENQCYSSQILWPDSVLVIKVVKHLSNIYWT